MRKGGSIIFPKSIVGDAVNPKDLWHGGAYYYPRISCMGVRYKKAGMSELATVTPVLTFPVSCLISYNAIIAIINIVCNITGTKNQEPIILC